MSDTSTSSSNRELVKVLAVLVAVLIGSNVALVAGIVTASGGANLSNAITIGGAGFVAATGLVLAIETALGWLSK